MDRDALVNDFALRSFRDMADGDYIAARMACRAALLPQFLWASQQAVEKYLKCILLLNRIDAREAYHDLGKALDRIDASGKLSLDLTAERKNSSTCSINAAGIVISRCPLSDSARNS